MKYFIAFLIYLIAQIVIHTLNLENSIIISTFITTCLFFWIFYTHTKKEE
jgi:uncharacterized MnhB-related membrane protein